MTDHSSKSPSLLAGFHLPGLKGKKVVITAGASGIGFSIARLLHAQGVKIAICDVDTDALRRASAVLEGCVALEADVSDEIAVDTFFDTVQDTFGGLDALVNNAGIAGPTGNLEDLSPDDWRRCIDICLTGQFLSARRAIPMIKAAGGGALVNMASAAAKHGYAFRTPYSAAKFGVIGLTQSLAKELGPDNIRVNAILPGIVEGPRMEKVIRDRADAAGVSHTAMRDDYLKNISMRRMVTPDDVAATVAFLISDAGANLSGQSLAVDGNVETL
ncbi:3-oxoacyl-[acyl-carrier-protein] reductase [Sedimentitalea sp. CY04]|uniref:SDR family oxidoreductase n=2 Tax=Parasedimentitalea TaxID=2738399 RepID=A0A6A4RF93_9RHOB|nr:MULTISPECIES: SDR family oxidoreductase [Paracoccaceae]KAE9628007.1 SDR family oxidoreductase [Zongyanglinia marina]NIZ63208.1 3-oxoacyl-[acyl-carrier-protein] reductase [Sedimentitalea sp. CY04]